MSDPVFFFILLTASALFGMVIGAYAGTIDYRIRKNLPLVTSECFCPCCGHTLSLYHQIPVLSFFLLKGKCRFCQTPIPLRYPLTEGGFLLYYAITFLSFFRTPLIYLSLWYIFICILLICRCRKHYLSLLKGLGIMTLYHAMISVVYLVLYAASSVNLIQ